jgi:hypothetical protein
LTPGLRSPVERRFRRRAQPVLPQNMREDALRHSGEERLHAFAVHPILESYGAVTW